MLNHTFIKDMQHKLRFIAWPNRLAVFALLVYLCFVVGEHRVSLRYELEASEPALVVLAVDRWKCKFNMQNTHHIPRVATTAVLFFSSSLFCLQLDSNL